MKGNAILFHNFIEGNRTQYIIPVYQRNYDWLIENCDQLFNDLVKVNETQMHTHFFGSIVTAQADSYGYNRLVIDGQQRITTISLLLLAGIKAVKDGKLEVSDESRIEEAYEVYLKAKFCNIERRKKLVPIHIVSDRYPDIVDTLYDTEGYFWSSNNSFLGYCTQIAPDKYVWTSMDNKSKLRCLRYLFEKCDIAESELVLLLEPQKEN